MKDTPTSDHADSGWDDYAERVLRNEGRLGGLETLVAETREADRKLIEQRAESLARELERRAEALLELVTARADAVLALGNEEREADRREVLTWQTEHEKLMLEMRTATRREGELALGLLREVYDTAIKEANDRNREAIRQNYEQSREAIHALEQRRAAATDRLEQMVRQWRESDREARELFAAETTRHLEQLNHNNERMATFQSNSVTRELWQAEKDAAIAREGLLRDQIIQIDRVLLTMTPVAQSEKAYAAIREEIRVAVNAAAEVLTNKIGVVDEKVAELKTFRDTTTGRSSGYTAFYGWLVAALGLILTVVIAAASTLGR